jgi:Tc5 transposase DNA-binding domain
MSSTIEQALEGVIREDFPSIRATALAWSVDRPTLTRRLNGGVARSEGHASQQLLSKTQEKMLVNWILEQERLGHAPTHQRIRKFAAKIRGFSGEDPHVGKNWLTRCMGRNPAVRTKVGRKIEYQRAQNPQPEVLKPWFHQFKALVDLYKVDSANIWNMDESGLGLGRCSNQQVVGGLNSKRTYVQSPETRALQIYCRIVILSINYPVRKWLITGVAHY